MGTLKRRIIEDMEPTEYELARRWIPVEERLPEHWQEVLACVRLPHWTTEMPSVIETLIYDRGSFFDYESLRQNYVTHWMPLPEPPAQ